MSSRRVTASAARQRRLGDTGSGHKPPSQRRFVESDRAASRDTPPAESGRVGLQGRSRVQGTSITPRSAESIFCLMFGVEVGGCGIESVRRRGRRSGGGRTSVGPRSGLGQTELERWSVVPPSDRDSFQAEFATGMRTVGPGSAARRASDGTRVTRRTARAPFEAAHGRDAAWRRQLQRPLPCVVPVLTRSRAGTVGKDPIPFRGTSSFYARRRRGSFCSQSSSRKQQFNRQSLCHVKSRRTSLNDTVRATCNVSGSVFGRTKPQSFSKLPWRLNTVPHSNDFQ